MQVPRRRAILAWAVAICTATSGVAAAVAITHWNSRVDAARQPADETPPTGPKAVLEQGKFELGTIESADDFKHAFVIRNEGDAPLELVRGPSTCACTVTDLPEGPVPPGGRVEVNVGFSATVKNETLKAGLLSRGVTLLTNDPSHERLLLGLVATVSRRLAAEPSPVVLSLRLEDMASEKKRSASALIYSQRWDRFDLAAEKPSREGLACRIEPAADELLNEVQARSGYCVRVTLPSDMPDGPFAESLELTGRPAECDQQPCSVKLEIRGSVEGRASMFGGGLGSDGVLHFGAVPEGASKRDAVLMKINDERRTLGINSIEAEPAFLRARVAPHAGAANRPGLYRIEVEVPPTAPSCNHMGEQAGTIRLKTDHPRLPVIELKVDFAVIAGSRTHLTRR